MKALQLLCYSLGFIAFLSIAFGKNISGDACSQCDCSAYYYYYTVDCFNRSLCKIPDNIPLMVTKLNLSQNYLPTLPKGVFMNLTKLVILDISSNKITEISEQSFAYNVMLKTIKLSSNKLQDIPESLFEKNLDLRTLNLSNNPLGKLPGGLFARNRRLFKLKLNNIQLRELPEEIFEKIVGLKIIDVSSNNLTNISPKTFANNAMLDTIHIFNNSLTKLPTNIFHKNQQLKTIDLSNNPLMYLSKALFATNYYLVTLLLRGMQLEQLPEEIFQSCAKLKVIYLSNNNLQDLPEKLFEKNMDLTTLTLSNNPLRILPKDLFARNYLLYELELNNVQLTELPEELFQNIHKLTVIDVSENNLKIIAPNTFLNNGLLNRIKISNNSLTKLPTNIFHGNQQLKTLILSHIQLEELSEEIFQNCTNLKVMVLSHNKLTEIPENIFSKNALLSSVTISNNSLLNIPQNIFANNPRLEVLAISNNSLMNIPGNIFAKNFRLKKVTISHNKLVEIPGETFANNKLLASFSIPNNHLTNIPRNLFANNAMLGTIILTANNLKTLPDGLFKSTTKLQRLHLCFNKLKDLPENLFSSLGSLQQLTICGNNLSMINRTLLSGFHSLIYLNLYSNSLPSLPPDLFMDVSLDGAVDLSYNDIFEIPERLFDSNETIAHNLTWLLLNNNRLVYIRKENFRGLRMLTHIFLHGNRIKALGDDIFTGTQVQFVYMFSNNLIEITNKSFHNGCLRELQVYQNGIKNFTADAFPATSNHIQVYLKCYDLTEIPLLNKQLKATCITDGVLPKIRISSMYGAALQANLMNNGFECSFKKGISECSPCPPGTYGYRKYGCQPCPAGGFYQDDVGRLNCSLCKVGTFVNHSGGNFSSDCELCPEGTDLTRHAGNRACFCKVNYARTHRFQGCSLCLQEGLNCSQDFQSLKPGYYWDWTFPGANSDEYSNFVFYLQNDSLRYNETTDVQYRYRIPKVHKCPQQLSCENRDSFSAKGIKGRCKDGYRGWLCTKCQKTFYSVLSYCLPCPNKIWIVIEVLAVVCLGFGMYRFILWQSNKNERMNKERTIVDKISSQTKIALGFYQVVGELFESFHDVTWVGPLQFMGEIISVLKINILRAVIRPHCYNEKLYIDVKLQFIIIMSFPIALLFVLGSLYHVYKLYLKLRKWDDISNKIATLKRLKERLLTYTVLLLFITYPPTCDVIFKLYPGACETFYIYENDSSVNITLLRSDFDLHCETLNTYQILAYIATGMYVASFPCVLLLILRKYSKTNFTVDEDVDSNENQPHSTVSERSYLINDKSEQADIPVWIKFLCENYKPQYWYWEIIELARKVAQTVLVTLLGWEDALTKLLTIGTSVLFLTLHAKLSPMTSRFEQRLQLFSLSAIFINVLVASVPIPENYKAPLSTILIIMNMIIIVIIAGEVMLYVIRYVRGKLKHV